MALVNFVTDPKMRDTHAYYMNLFRRGGFIDPTYAHHYRGERIPYDRDYGTVTIARNPYSDPARTNFVAILAAGVSLPGTMHSLTLLREARTQFADRPFGGIYSVELTEMEWGERVTKGKVDWSTEGYDLDKLRRGLQDLKTRTVKELTTAEIDQLLDLLDQIIRNKL